MGIYNIVCDVLQKLYDVPGIHAVLREAGSRQGHNVSDSHTRLRVMMDKAGADVEHRIWAVECLFYTTKRLGKDVSAGGLKGDRRAGNKGLCDLLIFKHSLKRHLFHREAPLRADDLLLNTDVPFAQWLEHDVEPRVTSYGQPHMACRPDSK